MTIDIAGPSTATIDSRRWPAVARVPQGPASITAGAIADRLVRRAAARLPIRVRTVDMFSLRPHYAETLRLWRERFAGRRETLSALGFDEVFQRMWELCLAYSEAGFRSGYLAVYQWAFGRTG